MKKKLEILGISLLKLWKNYSGVVVCRGNDVIVFKRGKPTYAVSHM